METYLSEKPTISIGLLDCDLEAILPDFANADISIHYFSEASHIDPALKSHGTYSASLLVAQGHENFLGLAPNAKLLFASIIGANGYAEARSICDALKWLKDSAVDIIAMPIGSFEENDEVSEILDDLADRGICLLAAAGNAHPFPMMFPASHPRVISVGAVDHNGVLLPDCCRNPDLVMPGYEIAALVSQSQTEKRSGSSVACVVAAAMAAHLFTLQEPPPEGMSQEYILDFLKGVEIADILH